FGKHRSFAEALENEGERKYSWELWVLLESNHPFWIHIFPLVLIAKKKRGDFCFFSLWPFSCHQQLSTESASFLHASFPGILKA
ncbi:MAG TPA: hypothetical protein VK536_07310, partial [Candidatus Limnocylindrales bacterium]|nr:hypothetical protein [Candidatus Limnocylindrales bacterium]